MPVQFESGRIEAFSDGVFAIAATLLVLEIAVPAESFDDLWNGIVGEWPSYLAYRTSSWTMAACGCSTTASSGACGTPTRT